MHAIEMDELDTAMRFSSKPPRWSVGRTMLAALVAGAIVVFLPSGANVQEAGPEDVEGTRAALEKYVETRRILSAEERDWQLGRELLGERIELLQGEIESLRGKITDAKASIAEAEKKRAGLAEESERLAAGAKVLGAVIIALETRTKELLQRLPDPIRERVAALSQSIPEKPEETELRLGVRFQNVVGILNEVDKFQREVALTSEVRTLSDGTSAEVTALYLGIGQSYYATANGSSAGVGRPTAEGWAWEEENEAAALVLEAIAVSKNEQAAHFVRLPIRIE